MKTKLNINHTVYTYSNFREVKLMDIYILLDSKFAELELLKSVGLLNAKYLKIVK